MDMTTLRKYIGDEHEAEVMQLLDENGNLPFSIRFKNPKITLILSVFLGFTGVDRLYQGGVRIFLCKLAMLVLSLGTWWLADIGYSPKETRRVNYEKLMAHSHMS